MATHEELERAKIDRLRLIALETHWRERVVGWDRERAERRRAEDANGPPQPSTLLFRKAYDANELRRLRDDKQMDVEAMMKIVREHRVGVDLRNDAPADPRTTVRRK